MAPMDKDEKIMHSRQKGGEWKNLSWQKEIHTRFATWPSFDLKEPQRWSRIIWAVVAALEDVSWAVRNVYIQVSSEDVKQQRDKW